MNSARSDTSTTPRKPLRIWPGVVAVVLQWLARFGLKAAVPGFQGFAWGAQGGLLGAVAVVLWWALLSRAAWFERLGALVLMIVAMGATWSLRHQSMGPFWLVAYAIPVLCLAFVAWAVASRRLPDQARRATMAATIVAACGGWALVRTDGITGDHVAQFAWRWTQTPEEKAIALAASGPAAQAPPPAPAVAPAERVTTQEAGRPTPLPSPPPAKAASAGALPARARDAEVVLSPAPADAHPRTDWPGFRGPHRNGVVRGVRLETNWSASPPIEVWRRPVGPGWSSFAVRGDRVYTQEQRGDDEVVSCYEATTGQPVWSHRDPARFFESNGGAGPRATPTLSQDRVYTFGATGILNALDAAQGTVVWSRNVATDTGSSVPYWGFASSPLVVDDLVIVAAAGQLVGYELATGSPRWIGSKGGEGYSSPHRVTLGGVAQVLFLSGAGATSVAAADGKVLWEHSWKGFPMVQPAVTGDGDVLIVASSGSGTRRLAVAQESGEWTVEPRWTSPGLKPYFNDFVVHGDHAFGFDGRILACIDLHDGEREWKGGRYGNGQLVLLSDQNLLLVLSEEGELALVGATPEQFRELARFKVTVGKTWNHPVLVGDLLLVRNAQEMVAFRLPVAR